jgi:hypothetical protein
MVAANVTLNIQSVVLRGDSVPQVDFAEIESLDVNIGGTAVTHSATVEDWISATQVVANQGLISVGFKSRATLATLIGLIGGGYNFRIAWTVKDIEANTGITVSSASGLNDAAKLDTKLVGVAKNVRHNVVGIFVATFITKAVDGRTNPFAVS